MKNLNIGTKIMGMVGILLLLMVACAGFGIFKIDHVGDELHAIANEDIPLTEAITEITINQLEQAIWFERSLRFGKVLAEKHAATEGLKHAITEFNDHTQIVDKTIKEAHTLAQHAVESSTDDSTRQEFEKITGQIETIEKHHKDYEDHAHEVFELIRKGELHDAEVLAEKVEIEEEELDHELEMFLKEIEDYTHKAAEKAENDEQAAFVGMVSITAAALIIGLMMGFFLTRAITKPIHKGVAFAKALADGDLTQKLNVDQEDEIGILAGALNRMAVNLREMFENISDGVGTLTSSSTELSAISQQMAAGSEQSSGKAQTVSAAAEEMTVNMQAVASASEQTSTNVQMVATATEQMTATINEIAGNTEKGRKIAIEAVDHAVATSSQINDLGKAVQQIGKVTEAIAEVSEQTNLLALNATIEAARAGEAGKGFAVVANEIKELAKQTADATKEIGEKISNIQLKTGDTVSKMDQISAVIGDLSEIVTTVASAMTEQSAATGEISDNVSQAAQGIQEVNKNIAETTTASNSISQDIAEVNQAAQEIATGSSQVNSSAQDLSSLAEQLNQMMSRYTI
ncbi:MAG: methyl-accepting chemotaxis protein [Desulfobacteraceae bacterium]|nr:methyl-accepting chemotaxis protein [Desulfobacteraceae bacterium]